MEKGIDKAIQRLRDVILDAGMVSVKLIPFIPLSLSHVSFYFTLKSTMAFCAQNMIT
jgi:hypothetical protein